MELCSLTSLKRNIRSCINCYWTDIFMEHIFVQVFECFNMVPTFGCKMVQAWNEVSCKGMQIALAANTARKIPRINADHNHKFHWNTNTNTNTSSHIQQINVTWHTTVLQRNTNHSGSKYCTKDTADQCWPQPWHALLLKHANTNTSIKWQILAICFLKVSTDGAKWTFWISLIFCGLDLNCKFSKHIL